MGVDGFPLLGEIATVGCELLRVEFGETTGAFVAAGLGVACP